MGDGFRRCLGGPKCTAQVHACALALSTDDVIDLWGTNSGYALGGHARPLHAPTWTLALSTNDVVALYGGRIPVMPEAVASAQRKCTPVHLHYRPMT